MTAPTTRPGPAAGTPPGAAGAPSTSVAPGPDRAAPVSRSVSERARDALDELRGGLTGTPGRLRQMAVVGVLAGILLGLTAGQAFRAGARALEAASDNAEQVVRVQEITTDLVRADAAATNAFLVGGLEPADQRAVFTEGLAEASDAIAQAARSQPADADALGVLNRAITEYSGLVEAARANNRAGDPVGAAYLRNASTLLRDRALPVLDALVRANTERVEAELRVAQWAVAWVVVGGLLALGLFVWMSFVLARLSHRYLSVPVVAAGAFALAVLLVGGVVLFFGGQTAREVRDGAYAATLALSNARVAAFDAKANESLTLVARGSGDSYEAAWLERAAEVDDGLGSDAVAAGVRTGSQEEWSAYVGVHQEIRTLDDGGNWEDAVVLATGEPLAGSTQEPEEPNANTTFAAFDEVSAGQLAEAGTDVELRLNDPVTLYRFLGWVAVLVGLVAALAAWWGVAARLEEYR